MSKESSLFYQLGITIRSGDMSLELGNKKCGTLVHSHWLTTGTAILLLYCSHHGLDSVEEKKLAQLGQFTVQMYWELKVKHSILEAPRHILTSLDFLGSRNNRSRTLSLPTYAVGLGLPTARQCFSFCCLVLTWRREILG